MKNFKTNADSKIVLCNGGEQIEFNLYSQDGADLVNALSLKLAAEFQWMYQPTWMGRPIIQLPNDIVAMQELLWAVKPDVIVECGVAHGGSLIFSASICQLIGKGKVVGVDVEIRAHNRKAIEEHFLKPRIELIEGSSVEVNIVEKVRSQVLGAETVLVVLDSNHTREHVLKEMEFYHEMVTPESYLVVMDGAQAYVGDVPRAKSHWNEDHPLQAIEEFLKMHPNYIVDPHYERFGVTCSPSGFLKKKKEV